MKKTLYISKSRVFCFFLLLLSVQYAFASLPEEALQSFISSGSLNPSATTVYVWDLDADYCVAEYNEESPIIPASVMKCVTTAALANVLPYTSTLNTEVYLKGRQSGESFNGVLLVKGAGDPSLEDNLHKNHPSFINLIVKALSEKGIKNFTGEIEIDNTLFAGPETPASWQDGDRQTYYGTGCHAFNFERNASGKKSVKYPDEVFKKKLKNALTENHISFNISEESLQQYKKSKPTLLLRYQSPILANLMRSCIYRSDNLYAEAFMRLFGLQNGADGSPDLSSKMMMQHWDALNFPLEGVEIVDGSGLSRNNRLTAEFLGLILRYKKDDPEYVSLFPLVGEEGTVKGFMADTHLKGKLALKTGSMNGIQSYAGYLLDGDYMPTHVVVVMTNDLKNRTQYRNDLSKFFCALFPD